MQNLALELLQNPAAQIVLFIVFITGIIRGFAGFGSGMIIGPSTAALFTPKLALALIVIVDGVPTAALVWANRRHVVWFETLPVVAGYLALAPVGIWILKTSDPTLLRWFIAFSIMLAVAVLWSGWVYRGPRSIAASFGVGSAGGFMGAAAALPGPPALLYWLAGLQPARTVRANMIYYLFLTDMILLVGYFVADIFSATSVVLGLLCIPGYLIGIWIGSILFGRASETFYRRVAYLAILAAAITSLPFLDPMLRG